MYKVGQFVRLTLDEGLDTPTELQGQIGIVQDCHQDFQKDMPSYTVKMLTGEEVYCEEYHLERVNQWACGIAYELTMARRREAGE